MQSSVSSCALQLTLAGTGEITQPINQTTDHFQCGGFQLALAGSGSTNKSSPKWNLQASVDGGVSVPVFVDEEDLSFGALVKQATALGMGGWWLGGGHMKPNLQFLNNVRQQIPVDGAKVIVACQKGLR